MGLCVQSTPLCDVLLTHGGNAHKQIRRHLTNAGTTTFMCSNAHLVLGTHASAPAMAYVSLAWDIPKAAIVLCPFSLWQCRRLIRLCPFFLSG